MINLKLQNGKRLMLAKNSSINLKISNPLFLENFQGDYSYPFTLDRSLNDSVLDFQHYKHILDLNLADHESFVHYKNQLIASGKLRITEVGNESYKAYFKTGSNNFLSANASKYLKDLALPSYYLYDTSDYRDFWGDSVINEYDTQNYYYAYHSSFQSPKYKFVAFPVFNDIMFQGTNKNTMWQYFKTWNLLPLWADSISGGDGYEHNYWVAAIYVAEIIELIFKESGYTLLKNPFKMGELRRLTLFTMYRRNDYTTTNVVALKDHVADMNILDFLKELRKIFAIDFFFDENNRTARIEFIKDILTAEVVGFNENIVAKSRTRSLDARIDGYLFSYQFNDDESTMYLSDFFPNKSEAGMEFLIQPTLTPCADSTIHAYDYLPAEFKSHPNYPGLHTAGAGVVAFISRWQQRLYEESSSTISLTKANIIDDYSIINQNIKPKLAFWRGAAPSANINYYHPLGTSSIYYYNPSISNFDKLSAANISLKWEDTYDRVDHGLFSKFYSRYVYWQQNIKLPELFQKKLSMHELIHIMGNIDSIIHAEGQNYIIKEIDVSISNQGIKNAKISVYKV